MKRASCALVCVWALGALFSNLPAEAGECSFAPNVGPNRVLVILVNFSDTTPAYTRQEIADLFFGDTLYSFRGYYREVSGGLLDPVGDVTEWLTASHPHDYYSLDDVGQGGAPAYPNNAQSLGEEAVDLAYASGVDFSLYDNSGDGCVDSILILHQGVGGESEDKTSIHSYVTGLSVGGAAPRFYNGVKIDRVAFVPEISHQTGGLNPIGVPVHEYGHLMGLIDLYDKDRSSLGIGVYDLMGLGNWGGDGASPWSPVLLSPYSMIKMGWREPVMLGGSTQGYFELPAVEHSGVFYKVPANPSFAGEYFLLENRQRIGFDYLLPGSGLLVYHVDERGLWENNQELIGCGYYMPQLALEQADGLYELETYQSAGNPSDYWPLAGGTVKDFTHASLPDSLNHDCRLSGVSITEIGLSGETVSLRLRTDDFRPAVNVPWLLIDRIEWVETSGDGDGYPEEGESVRPRLTLLNNGSAAANLSVSFLPGTPHLSVGDSVVSFPDLGPGDTAAAVGPTALVGPGYKPGRTYYTHLHAVYDGDSVFLSEAVRFGEPNILFVDDDGGAHADRDISRGLLGYDFYFKEWDVAEKGTPLAADLAPYEKVLWITGAVDNEPLSVDEIDALSAYLDGGGKLVLSSAYLLFDPTPAASSFAVNYLHVSSWSEDHHAIDWITGVWRDPLSHFINENVYHFYYPMLTRTTGLMPDVYAAGTIYNDKMHFTALRIPVQLELPYSAVFMSFGLENLRDFLPRLLRRTLNALHNWKNRAFFISLSPETVRPKETDVTITLVGDNRYTHSPTAYFPEGDISVKSISYSGLTTMKLVVDVSYSAEEGWRDIVLVQDGYTSRLENMILVSGPPVPNKAPVANAGPDGMVEKNEEYFLDGSASHDPDYDALTYQWSQLTGPWVTLLPSSTVASPSFISPPDFSGDFLFLLTVSDPWDSSGDTVRIRAINHPPSVFAGPDQSGFRADTFFLDGSSTFDQDNDPLTYSWVVVEGPPVSILPSSTAAAVYFEPDFYHIGDYVLELKVDDSWEIAGDTVRVSVYNRAPITDAGPDGAGKVGQTYCFDASSTHDLDGDTIYYEWFQVLGPATFLDRSNPVAPCITPSAVGNYGFYLRSSDPYEPGNSDMVFLTVTSIDNQPPIADAGPDAWVDWWNPAVVSLHGSSSYDPDDDALTYLWTMIEKPLESMAMLSDPAAPDPYFLDDLPGVYRFSLRVNDGEVWSATDYVTIQSELIFLDNDGDGLADHEDPDDDNDMMPDDWETAYGFDPMDPADGGFDVNEVTDPDGDGNVNLSEYFNQSDPLAGDALTCDAGLGGCFFGTSNGIYFFDSADISAMRNLVAKSSGTPLVYPKNGDGMDLDGDKVLTSADLSSLRNLVARTTTYYSGKPHTVELLSASSVSCLLGETVRVSVRMTSNPAGSFGPKPRSGVAVIFEPVTGDPVLLGGEAALPAGRNFIALDGVNTDSHETGFTLSADEREIIVATQRDGGVGGFDLYRSTRIDKSLPFGELQLLSSVNSIGHEILPWLSSDGLTLYFAGLFTGVGWEIMKATRPDPASPFSAPQFVVELNSVNNETGAVLSQDGLAIYFSRYSATTGYDIFRAERPDTLSAFSTPVPVPELNSSYADQVSSITADGLRIYFYSDRPGATGLNDIWMAERAATAEPFSQPTPLPRLNTGLSDYRAIESPDGLRLYFSTYGYHEENDVDIFMVSRPSSALDFWIGENPSRYEVTGVMQEGASPDSGGRAQMVILPRSCTPIEMAVYMQTDSHRWIPSAAYPGFVRVNVECPP